MTASLDEDRLHPRAELEQHYGRGRNLSVDVEDVTAVHGAVADAGHPPFLPLEERWYGRTDDEVGVRQLAVVDPDGYLLRPTQNLGARPLPQARSTDEWHDRGMTRARISTTVDQDLLMRAREAHGAGTDASLVEEALRSLLANHRRAEIDASYSAYDAHPIDEPDEWGDLASWRAAAAAS